MSLRSQRSVQSRGLAVPLSDEDLLHYCLKVAILAHIQANKPALAALPVVGNTNTAGTGIGTGSNSAAPSTTVNKQETYGKRESLKRSITESTSGWSSSFAGLSLGDLFRSDGRSNGGAGNVGSSTGGGGSSTSSKYPERFVKVLEHKIENVSRGTDSGHTDILLRYTVGAFYGKYKDPKNARAIKEVRKLEDLLMMFISTATDVLKKRCTGDEWKLKLEGQVESFVKICEECLRNKEVRHVPPELFIKLDTLKSKMSANKPPPTLPPVSVYEGLLDPSLSSSSTERPSVDTRDSTLHSYDGKVSFNVGDMPAVLQFGKLFGADPAYLQQEVNSLKKQCTEKAAMVDLKICVNLISANASYPGCREDFPSDEAHKDWRTSELSSLQQAMLAMIQTSPDLVQSSTIDDSAAAAGFPTNATHSFTEAGEAYASKRMSNLPFGATSLSLASTPSASSTASGLNSDENTMPPTPLTDVSLLSSASAAVDPSISLTYVPPDVRQAYRRLLELMLSFDLTAMANLDPSEEVSLRILSRANTEILSDCVVRWRVMPTFRFVTFLEDMSRRYAAGEMPVIECVLEALGDFERLDIDWRNEDWPMADRRAFLITLSSLFDTFLRAFYETYSEQLPQASIPPLVDALGFVHDHPLFPEAVPSEELDERFEQLRDGMRRVSDFLYDRQRDTLLSQQQQQPHDSVIPMIDLLEWIKATTKRLDKDYKAPLLGAVDVPQLFLERVPDIYFQELGRRLAAIEAAQPPKLLYTTPHEAEQIGAESSKTGLKDGEIMALYQGVKDLTIMHDAFCPSLPLQTSLNHQFEPYITRWLTETHQKTLGWVRNAINIDEFSAEEALEGGGHSSSIEDLIASCKGAVQFVTELGWPDEYQNALFMTKLSATVSKAIEQYCIAIEELFLRETTPPKRDSEVDRDERTSAWLTRAKALYQEKKLVPFHFKPTSCIKLNNIHAARQLLDKMYTAIDADRVAKLTRSRAPPVPAKSGQASRNLFTIKVVLGEGLATSGGVSRVDPFVTLSDERGLRIAKTRTLYETSEPRWAETFDISVEGKMWIAATVWNRNLVDEHELLGRSYISLDPHIFGDFLPHDLWQDLDTVGRLLLRVSMEGEKDDIQFFFGRAFRSLKRAENDMTRNIVDKISPFIRSCISQASLRSLLKQGGLLANFNANLSLDKAFDKARFEFDKARLDNVRNLIRPKDHNAPEIPLPPSILIEDPSTKHSVGTTTTIMVDRKKAPGLTDAEIEEPLAPLLEYLEQTLEVFRKYLSESAWKVVMTKTWKEVLTVIEGLLVPALSDQPTEMKPLSDREVDIVFKWLKFLTDFFYADAQGVPIEDLRNPRYRAVMMIRFHYDWSTDQLMEECVRLTNQQLAGLTNHNGLARNKSVYQQRNLGTIRQRKQEKNEEADSGAAEMVMRILRMRPGAIDFIQQQMATLNLVQERQRKPTRLLGSIRGRGRGKANRAPLGQRLSASVNRLPPVSSSPMLGQPPWKQYR